MLIPEKRIPGMNHRDFAYWLQGFFEMNEGNVVTPEQAKTIKDHLALTFDKQTPYFGVNNYDINASC